MIPPAPPLARFPSTSQLGQLTSLTQQVTDAQKNIVTAIADYPALSWLAPALDTVTTTAGDIRAELAGRLSTAGRALTGLVGMAQDPRNGVAPLADLASRLSTTLLNPFNFTASLLDARNAATSGALSKVITAAYPAFDASPAVKSALQAFNADLIKARDSLPSLSDLSGGSGTSLSASIDALVKALLPPSGSAAGPNIASQITSLLGTNAPANLQDSLANLQSFYAKLIGGAGR